MTFLPSPDPVLATKVLAREHPGFKVDSIELEHQGMDNFTFRVNREWIFRFATEHWNRFDRERWVLEALEGRTTLRIPQVELTGEETVFLAYRRIDGRMLGGDWILLNSREQSVLADQLAQFLLEIHRSVPPDLARANGVGGHEEWLEPLAAIQQFIDLAAPERWKLPGRRLLDRFEQYGNDPGHSALLHQDLHGENVIVDERNRVAGVIDFGDVGVGDIHKDFFSLLWMPLGPMEAVAKAYERLTNQLLDRRRIHDYFAFCNLWDLATEDMKTYQWAEHCVRNFEEYVATYA